MPDRRSKGAAARTPATPKPSKFDISSGGFRPKPKNEATPKPKAQKKPKARNDPRLVAAARELRDRWLEHINTQPLLSAGKYDVSRQLACSETFAGTKLPPAPIKQLPNAA